MVFYKAFGIESESLTGQSPPPEVSDWPSFHSEDLSLVIEKKDRTQWHA